MLSTSYWSCNLHATCYMHVVLINVLLPLDFCSDQRWKVSATIVRIISALFSIFLGLVLFVFVPTLIFQEIEKWSLLESAYFVVITLTTVGFGDYVAGTFCRYISHNIKLNFYLCSEHFEVFILSVNQFV